MKLIQPIISKLTFLMFLFSIPRTKLRKKPSTVKIGSRTIAFFDQDRARPIITEIFYPAAEHSHTQQPLGAGIWKRQPEARNAPLLNIQSNSTKLPLILFSHGHGGSRIESSWLIYELVKRGYLVASIDHFGNTWDLIEEEESWKRWHRAQDISFAIHQLLTHAEFGNHIDEKNIGFAGFSLGGLTGIWLAGGKANLIEQTLKDDPKVLAHTDLVAAKKSYYEPRIKAGFLMAPAYALAFDPEHLQKISTPIYIITGGDDKIVSTQNAEHLAKWIPNSQLKIFPGKVGHFVFLNPPTTLGKIILPKEIILDQATSNIAKIHAEIVDEAIQFFNRHLKTNDPA